MTPSTTTSTPRYPAPDLANLPDDIRAKILEVQQKAGFIPNVFLGFARRPAEWRAFFAYHDALMLPESVGRTSTLTKGDREMIVTTTSAANSCLYCVVAHGAILRIYEKKPLLADQVAVNYKKADIMPLKLAMRFDKPKNAVMAAMSQASSSSNPCACRAAKSASSMAWDCKQTFMAKSSMARWRGVMSAFL